MNKLIVSTSPHMTGPLTTRRLMLDVCIALLPAVLVSILFFGWNALLLTAVSVASAALAEFLFDLTRVRKWTKEGFWSQMTFTDCSCVVTGILLALNVPADAPVYIVILGSMFAILVVKMLFGGIGKNFANPALAARIFLFIGFPMIMSAATGVGGSLVGLDESAALSGATWLGSRDGALVSEEFLAMFLGTKASCAMGEVSILALLVGYVYLCVRKVIDWRIPLILIGSAFVFAFLFDALPAVADGADAMNLINLPLGHILSGGLVFGAVFMATDYSTTPNTFLGHVIFAVGVAFLAVLIRTFSGMPEGMSFAILLMNVIAPLIDKYCVPKPFGYVKPVKEKKTKKSASEAAQVETEKEAKV